MMNMSFKREMPTARVIKEMYPLSDEQTAVKSKRPRSTKYNLGKSPKILLVIGPCSIDREDAVLDYVERLRGVQDKVQDKIVIVLVSTRISRERPATATKDAAPAGSE